MCARPYMHWVLCTQVGIIRRRPASIHICLPSSWKSLPRSVTCNFQLLHARTTLIAFPLHICVSLLIWQHQQLMHQVHWIAAALLLLPAGQCKIDAGAFYDFVCAGAMVRFGTILLFLEVAVSLRNSFVRRHLLRLCEGPIWDNISTCWDGELQRRLRKVCQDRRCEIKMFLLLFMVQL